MKLSRGKQIFLLVEKDVFKKYSLFLFLNSFEENE